MSATHNKAAYRVFSGRKINNLLQSPKVLSLLAAAAISFVSINANGCEATLPVVAIDVGHSLKRPGAVSARGLPEFSFNKALAITIRKHLEQAGNIDFVIVNENGLLDELKTRTEIAAAHKADFFVSIHHDSVQERYLSSWMYDGRMERYSDRFRGFSLFVSRQNPFSDVSLRLAIEIANRLIEDGLKPTLHHAEMIPGESRPLADSERGIYWFDDLAVLRSAEMPAILVEAGVIVHRDEEVSVQTGVFRNIFGRSIAETIKKFCHKL